MAIASYAIRLGEVENVDDEKSGGRIKVRLYDDNNIPSSDVDYAFPLLPKFFSITPKKGECVLILTEVQNNPRTQRFYIGPIISQPQYFEKDSYLGGFGTAASLMTGKSAKPLPNINLRGETKGSFPNQEDVALIGRTSEDIILKDGEVDIRCGIRTEADNSNDEALKGKVTFNQIDPAYIQLKHKPNISSGIGKEANSMVNVVADKINLIGLNRNKNSKYSEKFNVTDQSDMITDEDIAKIMENAHTAVFGDVLVKILNKMKNAILMHKHPYPGKYPIVNDPIKILSETNMDDIESNNVRLN